MKVYKKNVKNMLVKSNLPSADYVINPFIGCFHGCVYCYAEFMKRFFPYPEKWGDFIVIKEYQQNINIKNLNGKTVLISSVTDAYNPYNIKYNVTKKILIELLKTDANVEILTKSKFVLNDIEIIKKFKNIKIGISLNTLDDNFRKIIEPNASSINERIETLNELKKHGISTYVFISPIFPQITDCEEIINCIFKYCDTFYLENLNLRGNYKQIVLDLIKIHYPHLTSLYQNIYNNNDNGYWIKLESSLKSFCENQNNFKYKFFFYHNKIKKNSTFKNYQ